MSSSDDEFEEPRTTDGIRGEVESVEDLAPELAARIRSDFVDYNARFRSITRRARQRFETRDWVSGRADAIERIELYDACVDLSVATVERELGPRVHDRRLWQDIKSFFAILVFDETDVEFYKTYFSSVVRQIFKITGVEPAIEFVGGETTPLRNIHPPIVYRNYVNRGSLEEMFRSMLEEFRWDVDYADTVSGAANIARAVASHYHDHEDNDTLLCVDVVETVFYRDTRAYLLGRCIGWNRITPLVVALENTEAGIRLSGVVQTQKDFSALFGHTRSYFHADLESVGAAIVFLRKLLPHKSINELFTVLGRAKQGKTERYRDFSSHLDHARDQFITAPGDKGLVMIVFTLPSYDLVFKVIRDQFGHSKNTTREKVMRSYQLVFNHDKGGRLVDAQEYRQLKFPESRFSPELREELLTEASRSVRLEGDEIVLGHVYVERRLRPLNLYLREVGPDAARKAVAEYGQAIRELAATNIFPGDLLLKNFGMSRHGRAIFYDYDELCLLTDCNFREMPEPRTHEDEMSAEPWYYVGEKDVFPEEFVSFLGLSAELKAFFVAEHGDLLTAGFWRDLQDRLGRNEIIDVQHYW